MKKEVGMMLKVENLNVHYGVIHAIEDVNIEVRDGEIVTLIGANGAGKTTILHTITGLKKATSGSVVFDGTDLLKEQPSKIITHGVAHVPEGRHVFVDMTVREIWKWVLICSGARIRIRSQRVWTMCLKSSRG